jgi:hypothetical protein
LTGGGGERHIERLTGAGAGEGRLGAGDRARADTLTGAGDGLLSGGELVRVGSLNGAGDGRLGAGDPARAERLTGAGEGRLGAGEPGRGGGERRVERLGAGEGRLGAGAGERILVVTGGERCTLLRRGVNDCLLAVPRSLTGSMSPCRIVSE